MSTSTSTGNSIVAQFVKLLKKRMAETGISKSALARDAGVGRPYLYRVLDGEQEPSMSWAEKVGKVLGITVTVSQKPQKHGRRAG